MAEKEKTLRRMMLGHYEVTLIRKGKLRSKVRTHFGYVVDVPNSELEEIPDPDKRELKITVTTGED